MGATNTVGYRGTPSQTCVLTETLTVRETVKRKQVTKLSSHARRRPKPRLRHVTVTLATRTVTVKGGTTAIVRVALDKAGRGLEKQFRRVPLTLTAALVNGRTHITVATRRLTLHPPKKKTQKGETHPKHGGR